MTIVHNIQIKQIISNFCFVLFCFVLFFVGEIVIEGFLHLRCGGLVVGGGGLLIINYWTFMVCIIEPTVVP